MKGKEGIQNLAAGGDGGVLPPPRRREAPRAASRRHAAESIYRCPPAVDGHGRPGARLINRRRLGEVAAVDLSMCFTGGSTATSSGSRRRRLYRLGYAR